MPTVRRLKLKDLGPQLSKDLGEIRRRVNLAVHETAGTGALLVRSNAPVAFGELADGIVGQSLGEQGARIRSTAPHSAAVEVGSRPHFPPIEPIERWVKLRGMQGLEAGAPAVSRAMARWIKSESTVYEGKEIKRGPNKGAVRIVRRKATDIDVPRQIAIMICRAIASRGTKPTWFMKRSLKGIWGILRANVKDWLSRPL